MPVDLDRSAPWTRSVAVVLTRRLALLAFLVLASVLSGCDDGKPQSTSTTSAPSTATATTTQSSTTGDELAALARRGTTTDFTGRYALDSTDPKSPDATVTIYRLGLSFRVDITRGSATSVLMTATQGIVSCQLAARRTCLLLGGPGTTPPKAFDPGLQRLVTTDLAALADAQNLTVVPAGTVPAIPGVPAATCYQVSGEGVDPGEYCLTADGVLRQAQFPSGTLKMTKLSAAPARTAFVPPASPTPVPR
jgi:hypothetical protein